MAVRTPLGIHSLGCDELEPLWLQAQSVPSASLVPCVRSLPAGWTARRDVAVNNGRSVITLDHDRAGTGPGRAADRRLRPTGAVRPSPAPGVRHQRRVHQRVPATWYDRFAGGCVTYRLLSTSDPRGLRRRPALLGFTSRDALGQALSRRSDGRLELDPGEADEPVGAQQWLDPVKTRVALMVDQLLQPGCPSRRRTPSDQHPRPQRGPRERCGRRRYDRGRR